MKRSGEPDLEPRVARFAEERGLPPRVVAPLAALLAALNAEPHAPTTIQDPERALGVHVADSLAGLEVPELHAADAIADIGSGVGFPGLPLAVALPDAQVDLVESSMRSCEVIDRLIAAAALENARSVAERVETWAGAEGREAYEAATVRALAPLAVLVEYAAPLLQPDGVLVAWKGMRRRAEEEAGDRAAEIVGLARTAVLAPTPFPQAKHRHLYVYRKIVLTPDRFPRRPGMAVKRPLA